MIADDILICMCDVNRRRSKFDHLCVLFVGEGVQRQPLPIIREHVVLEMNTGESRGS